MKKGARTSLASDDIPRRTFDQGAETMAELIEKTGHSRSWLDRFTTAQLKAGVWERVSKLVKKGARMYPTPAYRRKV